MGEVSVVYTTLPCMACGMPSLVELDLEKVQAWKRGALIQNVWPEKTTNERELLLTGTHPGCWDRMFGTEDQE